MSKRRHFRNISSVKEVTDRMLSTLESRRDQLASRSSVCLAAASGLLVLAVQLILEICDMVDYTQFLLVIILLLVTILFCCFSIVTSLDLIKKISRKKHMGKNQKESDPNIFFFGWTAKQSEKELDSLLADLTLRQHIEYEARQSISLSKNLEYRYQQLSKMYTFFVVGLIFYCFSILCFAVIKYSMFDVIKQFILQFQSPPTSQVP